LASPLAAPETRRGAIQIFLQSIKKALFENRPGLSSLEGQSAAFQELLETGRLP